MKQVNYAKRNGTTMLKWTALALAALVATLAMGVGATPAHATGYQAGSVGTAASGTIAQGSTFKVGGNTYRVVDYDPHDDDLGEVSLIKYGSTKTTVTVNTVRYGGELFEVDSIGKNAFNNARGHRVKSVTLGRNVDNIRAKAFYGCSKLKKLNLAKADVIDIDRNRYGYHIDGIDIGSNAFKKAGTSKVTVNCGSSNKTYQALYKQALMKKGMRSSVTVVK